MSDAAPGTPTKQYFRKAALAKEERKRRRREAAKKAKQPPADLREMEVSVGGRAVIIEALSHAPSTSPEVDTLRSFLADPETRKLDIRALCAKAHVSVPEFWALFKQGMLTRAQVKAMATVSSGLPEVAADIMARAVVHEVECPKCFGTGLGADALKTIEEAAEALGATYTPEREPPGCGRCQGTGKIEVVPEVKRQELALEMGGMLKRSDGVSVTVNQQQGLVVGQIPSLFAKFQMATDKILYGSGRLGLPGSGPSAPAAGGRPADGQVLEVPPVASEDDGS